MSNMNVAFSFDAKQEELHLLSSARAGNAEAFEQLVIPHVQALLRVTRRMLRNREDAEDTVQTALLNAWRNLNAFQGRSRFSSWLTRIAINSALMRLRTNRHKREVSIDEVIKGDMPASIHAVELGPDPEQGFSAKEAFTLVEGMFNRLPPHHAEVLRMSVQGLTGKEVARVLNVSVATVKSRLHQARTILSRSAHPMLGTRRRCANGAIRGTAVLLPETTSGD